MNRESIMSFGMRRHSIMHKFEQKIQEKKQLPKKETYAIMENCDMQNTNFSLLFCDGKGRRPEGGARNYESV